MPRREARARAQADGLTRRLLDLGAKVISAPVIRTEPVDGPPIDPSGFDLVVVTSPNTPPLLLERALPFVTVYSGQPEINVLTAPIEVLAAMPGLTPEMLHNYMTTRTGAPPGSPVTDMIPETPCATRSKPPLFFCGPVWP